VRGESLRRHRSVQSVTADQLAGDGDDQDGLDDVPVRDAELSRVALGSRSLGGVGAVVIGLSSSCRREHAPAEVSLVSGGGRGALSAPLQSTPSRLAVPDVP
jgi:hypothetical protein